MYYLFIWFIIFGNCSVISGDFKVIHTHIHWTSSELLLSRCIHLGTMYARQCVIVCVYFLHARTYTCTHAARPCRRPCPTAWRQTHQWVLHHTNPIITPANDCFPLSATPHQRQDSLNEIKTLLFTLKQRGLEGGVQCRNTRRLKCSVFCVFKV